MIRLKINRGAMLFCATGHIQGNDAASKEVIVVIRSDHGSTY
jgi:hypothetical protein